MNSIKKKRKHFKIDLEKPKEGINYERLLRALNLILSEDDLKNYSNQTYEKDNKQSSNLSPVSQLLG